MPNLIAALPERKTLVVRSVQLDHVVLDALGEFGRHYEVPGLPATFFIARDGTLQSVHMGEISREALRFCCNG